MTQRNFGDQLLTSFAVHVIKTSSLSNVSDVSNEMQ